MFFCSHFGHREIVQYHLIQRKEYKQESSTKIVLLWKKGWRLLLGSRSQSSCGSGVEHSSQAGTGGLVGRRAQRPKRVSHLFQTPKCGLCGATAIPQIQHKQGDDESWSPALAPIGGWGHGHLHLKVSPSPRPLGICLQVGIPTTVLPWLPPSCATFLLATKDGSACCHLSWGPNPLVLLKARPHPGPRRMQSPCS